MKLSLWVFAKPPNRWWVSMSLFNTNKPTQRAALWGLMKHRFNWGYRKVGLLSRPLPMKPLARVPIYSGLPVKIHYNDRKGSSFQDTNRTILAIHPLEQEGFNPTVANTR